MKKKRETKSKLTVVYSCFSSISPNFCWKIGTWTLKNGGFWGFILLTVFGGIWKLSPSALAQTSSAYWNVERDGSNNLNFYLYNTGTTNPTAMQISAGGKIGIGTTAPTAPLTVSYSSATPASHGVTVTNVNTTAGRTADLRLRTFDGSNYLGARIYTASDSPYGWSDQRLTFGVQGVGADVFKDVLTLKSTGNIVLSEMSAGNGNGYWGFGAPNGNLSDGVPYYFGIGREPGAWDGSTVGGSGSSYPDLVISNHTGIRLTAHGGYGGVSIFDQYNYTTGAWSSSAQQVARFRADPAGGSAINSTLTVGGQLKLSDWATVGASYPVCIDGSAWPYRVGSCNPSDRRLKENITYWDKPVLDLVKKLRPVTFDFIKGDKNQAGFIAQDVAEVLPDVVSSAAKDGMLSISPNQLLAYAIGAIQDLDNKLIKVTNEQAQYIKSNKEEEKARDYDQSEEINQLKEEITQLKEEIKQIKERK